MDDAQRIAELEAHNARLTEIVADAAELIAELEQRRADEIARVRREQEDAEARMAFDSIARDAVAPEQILERLTQWLVDFAPLGVDGAAGRLGALRFRSGALDKSALTLLEQGCTEDMVGEADGALRLCLGNNAAGPAGVVLFGAFDDAWKRRWIPLLSSGTAHLSVAFHRRDVEQANRRMLKEMTEARALAEEANRAKTSFLTSVSHELRTPLNVIIGYAELMLQDAEQEERSQEIADLCRIIDAGGHLLSMIDDILDFTRLEAGRIPLAKDMFDPADLIEEVHEKVRPAASAYGTPITIVRESSGPVIADRSRLQQVLQNLIGTSARLAPGGSVRVSVTVGAVTRFQIDVSGHEISNGQVTTLFEPLADAQSWEGRRFGCSGLGTAISRALILAMGGSVSVTTRPRGFRIVATVPLQRHHALVPVG